MKKKLLLMMLIAILLTSCSSAEEVDIGNSTYNDYVTEEEYEVEHTIEMQDVDSSCFSKVGYDYDNEILIVVFHNSGEYWYYDVPNDLYEEFISADSLGGFYNDYIKGQYACDKM